MSDGTKIEWTDATWNVVNGCSLKSPGCTHCYAMRSAGTRLRNHPSRAGLTRTVNGNPVWTGEVRFNEKVLLDPLRWRRPRRIFVCAHGDLFHENVPDEWIDRVFAVMALCPQHQFQVLTKRPERMRRYILNDGMWGQIGRRNVVFAAAAELTGKHSWKAGEFPAWPLPNVWLGVSVEDQARADERIPILLDTPAAVRWLSCEPLLGPVDLNNIQFLNPAGLDEEWSALSNHGMPESSPGSAVIDWVVVGGESGPGARPMHPDWARSLRDQCAAAGVPFLFKQWGDWGPREAARAALGGDYDLDDEVLMSRIGKKRAGRLLDGVQHDGFPA